MTTNLENKIEKEIDERDSVNAVTAEEKDGTVLDGKMYAEMINAGAANLKAHAQEMEDEVIDKHIALFVNDFSLSLGAEGRAAMQRLTALDDF